MDQIIIDSSSCNQRMDKFLKKYLPNAQTSFLYKMLRKKNIILNGKKATGSEILLINDTISIYFSDETLQKFKASKEDEDILNTFYLNAYKKFNETVTISYEDQNVIIFNKPAGLLSQKAEDKDYSLNEYGVGYLLSTSQYLESDILVVKPSICNRLDRNTSGLVIFGKTLPGLQIMNELIKGRNIKKYYRTFVIGNLNKEIHLDGYLEKNEKNNKVEIMKKQSDQNHRIITNIIPLMSSKNISYIEVELVTGKPHQIRAHLASIGHPIVGDHKYGDTKSNTLYYDRYQISHQLLHAFRLEFPEIQEPCQDLSNQTVIAKLPPIYDILIKDYFKK